MMKMERKLNYLVIWCFTFISISRGGQDLSTSCEVMVKVKSGTVWSAAPTSKLTVSCPVKDCGASLNVTWCKLSSYSCKQINNAEGVEIRQTSNKEELISYLSFKQISLDDDGLYRCVVTGHNLEVSHSINISVSDNFQGVEHFSYIADEPLSTTGYEVDWVPYFSICISLAFLVIVLAVSTILCFNGWNRKWISKPIKGQEMPIHTIPTLPNWSLPSPTVLRTNFSISNDIYTSSSTEILTSLPIVIPTESQYAATKTTVKSPESENAVYAVICHNQHGSSAVNPHATSNKEKNPTYAVINLPNAPEFEMD